MEKRKTKKDLEAAIEKMHIGGSIQFVECFHNFLDLALSYFCNNMNERQMALRKRVEENDDFRKAYQEALKPTVIAPKTTKTLWATCSWRKSVTGSTDSSSRQKTFAL